MRMNHNHDERLKIELHVLRESPKYKVQVQKSTNSFEHRIIRDTPKLAIFITGWKRHNYEWKSNCLSGLACPSRHRFDLPHQLLHDHTKYATAAGSAVEYMAPEYATRGYLTDKADVYSFGIVALELVSGRRNSNHGSMEERFFLIDRQSENVSQNETKSLLTDISHACSSMSGSDLYPVNQITPCRSERDWQDFFCLGD
ncbi:putative LRR receptor-like serine/threonine-protein kinase [Acorus gramineus]|uniref:LRR receptor-like serine/threonine-protein kinase n=1 Tax=Acorus gramineus TaxID=55184 RepID=A0AAV9BJF8_ACOGR|nr:putative LRR receptor-like serine/threonine-protein kinase [Acorus gramineus]